MVRLDADTYDWVSGNALSGMQPLEPVQWFDPGFDPYAPTPWMDTPQQSDQSNFVPWESPDFSQNDWIDQPAQDVLPPEPQPLDWIEPAPATTEVTLNTTPIDAPQQLPAPGSTPEIPDVSATPPTPSQTWDGNNVWINTDFGGVWISPNGSIWDEKSGGWVQPNDTAGARQTWAALAGQRDNEMLKPGQTFADPQMQATYDRMFKPTATFYNETKPYRDASAAMDVVNEQLQRRQDALVASIKTPDDYARYLFQMYKETNNPELLKEIDKIGYEITEVMVDSGKSVGLGVHKYVPAMEVRKKRTWTSQSESLLNDVIMPATSGNAAINKVGQQFGQNWDANKLPYGLNYVTDFALSPAFLATLATGGLAAPATIPALIAKEGAAYAGGMLASELAGKTAEQFTDNPYIIGGAKIGGGLVGGVAGYKAAGGIEGALRNVRPPELAFADSARLPHTGDWVVLENGRVGQVVGEGNASLQIGQRPGAYIEVKPIESMSGSNAIRRVDPESVRFAQTTEEVALPRRLNTADTSFSPNARASQTTVLPSGEAITVPGVTRVPDLSVPFDNPTIPNAVRKITPGPMTVSPQEVSPRERIGEFLNAPMPKLGATIKEVLKDSRLLLRRVDSVANSYAAKAAEYWRDMGPMFQGKDGNWYLKYVTRSAEEERLGLPGALAVRVVENPGEYVLNPRQRAAVEKLGELTARITREREALGNTVNRLELSPGEIYQHRVATKPSFASQIKFSLKNGELPARGGLGHNRLSIGKDASRQFEDAAQSVAAGTVYKHPQEAFAENVRLNLSKAANQHIKTLLTPFGETWLNRMDEPTRAAMEAIRGRLTNLQSLGNKLGKEFQDAVNEFMISPDPDISGLQVALNDVRVKANAVGVKGRNYGMTVNDVRAEIAQLKQDLKELAPQYKAQKARAMNIPPGRTSLSDQIAPALKGMDFTKQDAARIIAFYNNGIRVGEHVLTTNVPVVKQIARVVIPVVANFDASVLQNQGLLLSATHRKAFFKNLAITMRDIFDDAHYERWAGSDRVLENSKWISITGDTAGEVDFVARWIDRIPGMRESQKLFVRFGNRLRNDAFEDVIALTERRTGAPVDDTVKEQIGRAINRASGIASSTPSDIEQTLMFAPNFFRSTLENIVMAASDGSIEGQMARQYFKNLVALGSSLVAGVALYQNRDLREVLDPFDHRAWKRGEIRMNPNFMSIRVGGEDIKVFGQYDSLARLITVAANASYRSLNERDASKLNEFALYFAQSKGSTVPRWIADEVRGTTMGGEPTNSWKSWVGRAAPISVSQAIQSSSKDMSTKQRILDATLNAIGSKASPITDAEKRDLYVQTLGLKDENGKPLKSYYDANTLQRNIIDKNYGKLQDVPPEVQAARKKADELRAASQKQQQAIDDQFRDPNAKQGQPHPRVTDAKSWRELTSDLKYAIAKQWDAKEIFDPYTGKPYSTGMDKALREYNKVVSEASLSSRIDYDKVDAWMAANPDKAKLINEYLDNRIPNDLTDMTRANREAVATIRDSGFFDLHDKSWKMLVDMVKSKDPTVGEYNSYYDWRDEQVRKVSADLQQKHGIGSELADSYALNMVENGGVGSVAQDAYKYQLMNWLNEPNNIWAAVQAWRWGYWTPPNDLKWWLESQIKKNNW